MIVKTYPTFTNIYGGLYNSTYMAAVLPVPNSSDWYTSIFTGHTPTGWEQTQFPTRMQATVHARRELGLLPR